MSAADYVPLDKRYRPGQLTVHVDKPCSTFVDLRPHRSERRLRSTDSPAVLLAHILSSHNNSFYVRAYFDRAT